MGMDGYKKLKSPDNSELQQENNSQIVKEQSTNNDKNLPSQKILNNPTLNTDIQHETLQKSHYQENSNQGYHSCRAEGFQFDLTIFVCYIYNLDILKSLIINVHYFL